MLHNYTNIHIMHVDPFKPRSNKIPLIIVWHLVPCLLVSKVRYSRLTILAMFEVRQKDDI